MNPVNNPYAPGAGRPPAALVGRDSQLATWRVALDRLEGGRSSQSLTMYGLRGVGKTVLLTEFYKLAHERDWIAARVEAGTDKSLRQLLGEALHDPVADLARPNAGAKLLKALKTMLSFKASYDATGTWNFGLDLTGTAGGGADTGLLETDFGKLLKDLAAAASEEGVGLAILIDEAQDLSREELTAVCSAAHQAGQLGWPLLFALTGLPSLPRVLAEAKSYSERLFHFTQIEHLDDSLAWEAITKPAEDEGVLWDDNAVRFIVQETSGYPYFIQQFGQDTWNEAAGPTITISDAKVGAARGRTTLDVGFFRARWDRATRAEQAYLRAMALDGDSGSSSGEVAVRLGKRASSLGPARASLIAKGLIYAPEHGVVAFTVPGMADFIQRQPQN
ncbi:ATP-binding protein [Modestobacter roseus]|uniref:AAA ATPase-like protein n=1 Tax=Modestobacter roseus TaxID=1181884 RepID=A0A562IX74_9ACTN|nr:ATP-binding protein [Modestobacter roseus]MQA34910.1 AAA family ATPase [Modestobacter roseus]TWH75205.1 AAA ATPase-like protein [Modestobacter roseus]